MASASNSDDEAELADASKAHRSTGALTSSVNQADGPATLAEYCAGKSSSESSEAKIREGTKVKANWEGYGTMYPGRITDENRDGTVDIKYDDGFTEKRVDVDDVKVRKNQKSGSFFEVAAASPRDDPACKLQGFLGKLQNKLKDLNGMTSQWLAAQRAKLAGDRSPPPKPRRMEALAAAPAAAPPEIPEKLLKDESNGLEKLKAQLADREEYIKDLEKRVNDNNDALQQLAPATEAPPPGLQGVEGLIEQYKAKIGQRDKRIAELMRLIRQQEDELARVAAAQTSLADIDNAVTELERDVEEAKRKRDQLKKDGKLDPELRSIIDSIIKALAKTRTKVDNLIAAEKKAAADREAAERKAREAAAAARKKAEAEGKNPDEAVAQAEKRARQEAKEEIQKADLETLKAAQEVEKEMKEAEKGAKRLDTGLHPHGAKWWRYRYEHSYIEALLMIFISWLMLLWSVLVRKIRDKVRVLSQAPGHAVPTQLEEIEADGPGAMYAEWLHLLAEQMMVCILVFLTVWLIAKTTLIDFFPLIVRPSDDMRVPHTGQEYRQLALDICTIFFFAIMFYFGLIFSVANDSEHLGYILEEWMNPKGRAVKEVNKASSMVMGSLATDFTEFAAVKKHFAEHMAAVMLQDDQIHKDILRALNDDTKNLNLSKYLKFSVRLRVAELFHFGWLEWLPIMCLFLLFMVLHRYQHMGYVRIMGFFAIVTLAIIFSIAAYSKKVANEIHSDSPADASRQQSKRTAYYIEEVSLGLLQFALFVICYGVARMICQPWMWELHFWPVLYLTIAAVVSATLFVWLVSPGIPAFCALLAIPPYVDDEDLDVMLYVAKHPHSMWHGTSPRAYGGMLTPHNR